jgi:hypothetical protein
LGQLAYRHDLGAEACVRRGRERRPERESAALSDGIALAMSYTIAGVIFDVLVAIALSIYAVNWRSRDA